MRHLLIEIGGEGETCEGCAHWESSTAQVGICGQKLSPSDNDWRLELEPDGIPLCRAECLAAQRAAEARTEGKPWTCETCKHDGTLTLDEPCKSCTPDFNVRGNWEAKRC